MSGIIYQIKRRLKIGPVKCIVSFSVFPRIYADVIYIIGIETDGSGLLYKKEVNSLVVYKIAIDDVTRYFDIAGDELNGLK